MDERHEIARLAWQVGGEGFDKMEPEELDDLVASHAKVLTEEELDIITKVTEEEEEAGSDEEEVLRSNFMVKYLGEVLRDMWEIADRLQDADLVI